MIISINIHQTPLSYCSVEGGGSGQWRRKHWSGEAAGTQSRVNKLLLSQNFCNRPRDRGTCGTGSGAPGSGVETSKDHAKTAVSEIQLMTIVVYA